MLASPGDNMLVIDSRIKVIDYAITLLSSISSRRTTGWPKKLSMMLMHVKILVREECQTLRIVCVRMVLILQANVLPLMKAHKAIYFKPQLTPDSTPFRVLYHALTHAMVGLM